MRQKGGGRRERLPEKPRGMHGRTYQRLALAAQEAEDAQWAGLMHKYGKRWAKHDSIAEAWERAEEKALSSSA